MTYNAVVCDHLDLWSNLSNLHDLMLFFVQYIFRSTFWLIGGVTGEKLDESPEKLTVKTIRKLCALIVRGFHR